MGDLDFALRGLAHTNLINGEGNDGRTMFDGHGNDALDALPTGFHVDGVDDGAARIGFQGGFDDVWLC